MSSLKNEEVLMVSNDGLVTLTTHRVLQKSKDSTKELMLVDFISYEIFSKRVKYYKLLTIFFLIACIGTGIAAYYENEANTEFLIRNTNLALSFREHGTSYEEDGWRKAWLFSGFLFIIALLMFLLSKSKHVKLDGKFSSIKFSVKNLTGVDRDKFINGVIRESEARKKE